MVYFDFLFVIDSLSLAHLLFAINSLTFADLFFTIDSITVPDLLLVIKDTREKRQKVDKETGTKRINRIECENH
jgi:hypothetical protein